MAPRVGGLLLLVAATFCVAAPANIGRTQEFSRPLTIVVPFSAGGSSDQAARLLAGKLADSLGQSVIVDNRTGGNGQVAAAVVKQARPDGHTLLWASHGILAINPSLYSKLTYDAIKDFEPVTLVFKSTHFLLVPAKSTATSAADVVALARARPGQLSFASVGVGSGSHLVAEMFRVANKIEVVHVPYRGSTNALPDVVAGRIDYFFDGPGNAVELVRAGQLRALAVTDTRRFAQLPDVPTMAEAGFADHVLNSWFGLVAPAGTPGRVITKLQVELRKAMQSADLVARMAEFGAQVAPSESPQDFAAFIASENARLGKVVRDSGARLD
jgi:tripartite-type tricarboxylate transporter receptor subunit TctC